MEKGFSRRAGIYYVGSFDDEILRNRPDEDTLPSINDTLSQAALFGGRLLINDGQLMLTPGGRKALTSESSSPLRALMQAKYVSLFTRNGGDIAKLPEQMAATIPTYADLIRSDVWPALQMKLEAMPDSMDMKAIVEPWPALNLGPGFQRLINIALNRLERLPQRPDITDAQISKLQANFNEMMNADPMAPGRTVWRKECESSEIALSKRAREHLHWIGLEAYHFNLAIASSKNYPGRRSGVITRHSYLFNDYRDAGTRKQKGGASLAEIPRPQLPRSITSRDLQRADLLVRVVTSGDDLHNSKCEYLASVDAAISDRQALHNAQIAANMYSEELLKFFRESDTKHKEVLLEPATLVTGAWLTSHLKSHFPGSEWERQVQSELVKKGLEWGTAWLGKQFATHSGRMTSPLAVDVLDPLEDFAGTVDSLPDALQGDQWFAFLGLNDANVKEHIAALPPLK